MREVINIICAIIIWFTAWWIAKNNLTIGIGYLAFLIYLNLNKDN